jgi:hypothetical protein
MPSHRILDSPRRPSILTVTGSYRLRVAYILTGRAGDMQAMTKAKKKRPASAGPEMLAKGVRMTRTYANWLDKLAARERMSVSTLIDRAVADYASRAGFDAPPERVP